MFQEQYVILGGWQLSLEGLFMRPLFEMLFLFGQKPLIWIEIHSISVMVLCPRHLFVTFGFYAV